MIFKNEQELSHAIKNYKNVFDIVRLVNPVFKNIVECKNECADNETYSCYEFWKNNNYCNNCISSRAMNENDTFVKVEFNKENIYVVMASPVIIRDKKFAIEMLKDITNTGIIAGSEGKTENESHEIIKKLNEEAITDVLTNVYNRRFINEKLPIEINNANKNKIDLSVIMMDCDLFKNINDTYGHSAGDLMLKETCKIIKSNIRKDTDWVARYGGDEFLICLLGADCRAAHNVAENIRKQVENKEFNYEGHKFRSTVSQGICSLNFENILADELIKKADKKLYESKNNGRNIVSHC